MRRSFPVSCIRFLVSGFRFLVGAHLEVLALVAGCRDEQRHVFQPPPTPAMRAPGVASPPAAERSIGALGAEARISAVVDATTGAPVALSAVATDLSVMTIVARGPGAWTPDDRARVELVIRGPRDTTITTYLERPAPVIAARQVVIPLESGGFVAGDYTMQLRLIMRGSTSLAETIPLFFRVVQR